MSFSQRLKTIQTLIAEDTERCLQLISSKSFTNSLFLPQLRALSIMFEGLLQKKGTLPKQSNDSKATLQPQIVIGFYSIIVMRSNLINVRQDNTSALAYRHDQNNEGLYNSKLAIETLTKMYRTLEGNDETREIIAGILLKVKGFNNYKLVTKDINPQFVSDQTMAVHFQGMKAQCPNILEVQLNKYKTKWFKYLRYKPISFQKLAELFNKSAQSQNDHTISFWDGWKDQLQTETKYLMARFRILNEGEQIQKVNIDEIIASIDDLYIKLIQKIKQTAPSLKKGNKGQHIPPQYQLRQLIHKNYLRLFSNLLSILNLMISSIGANWIRKIKWLYNFIIQLFTTFNIKSTHFHQSIAQEYAHILIILVKIVTNYLITFKTGLFPMNKLLDITFNEEYSISKLIEALLYNQYPFNEAEVIYFQNYQKQRKNHENKSKQSVIDMVNFNMKSLNINLHWDSFFVKIIPNLKNSLTFAKDIIYQSLYFILKYFQISLNYDGAAKFLLMVANAKNSIFTTSSNIKQLISKIKVSVYPEKRQVKQGIQYFCEEYFAQYVKLGKKRQQQQQALNRKTNNLQVCRIDEVRIGSSLITFGNNLKKTESHDAIIQGWDNYDSIRDSVRDNSNSISELRGSINRPLAQNPQVNNNEMFYSITESRNERQEEENDGEKIEQQQIQNQGENQILLPDF